MRLCPGVGDERCNKAGEWTARDMWRCPYHKAKHLLRLKSARKAAWHRKKYGKAHKQTRAMWKARQEAGAILTCWRCRKTIVGAFDLDHGSLPIHGVQLPAHPVCNRGERTPV